MRKSIDGIDSVERVMLGGVEQVIALRGKHLHKRPKAFKNSMFCER